MFSRFVAGSCAPPGLLAAILKTLSRVPREQRPPPVLSHSDMQAESASLSASAPPGEEKTIPCLDLCTQKAGVGEINHGDCWLTYQPNSFPLTGGGNKWSFLDSLRITKYFLRHDVNHIFLRLQQSNALTRRI